jgi:hypothetical protein
MSALRVVDDGNQPVQRRRSRTVQKATAKATIQHSAQTGDRRRLLVTLRNHIAAQLDEGVPPRDLATLSLRLLAIAAEIAEIDAAVEGDDVSDAAATPDEVWSPS